MSILCPQMLDPPLVRPLTANFDRQHLDPCSPLSLPSKPNRRPAQVQGLAGLRQRAGQALLSCGASRWSRALRGDMVVQLLQLERAEQGLGKWSSRSTLVGTCAHRWQSA